MKKGSISSEMVFWFWRIIPTALILFFIGLFLFMFLNQKVNITELETKQIANHLIYDCLVHEENGKKHIGEIDMKKFTEEHISGCIRRDNLGYKVSLNKKSVSVMTAEQHRLFDVCSSIENFECFKEEKLVLINNNPSILKVEVIKNK